MSAAAELQDLQPTQQALVLARVKHPNKTQRAIAKELGRSEATVSESLSNPKVRNAIAKYHDKQMDKAGALAKKVRRVIKQLYSDLDAGEIVDWRDRIGAIDKLLDIQGKSLDIAERSGGSVEDTLTNDDIERAERQRRLSSLRMLRCGMERPERAAKLVRSLELALHGG